MSTLPTAGNGYAIDPQAFATVAFFEAVFSSVHARLIGVEANSADYEATIARLTTEALQTVSATLSVEIADQRALLNGIQASAEAVLDAYDQISLTGVPATQIRVMAIGAFNPINVQAALEAYKARLDATDSAVDGRFDTAESRIGAIETKNTAQDTALTQRLRIDAASYRKLLEIDLATTPMTMLVNDLSDDVNRFRVSLEGAATAGPDSLISMRCGVAGAPAEAGESDYSRQIVVGVGSTLSTQDSVSNAVPLATVGPTGLGRIIAEGHVGDALTGWSVETRSRTNYSGGNQIVTSGNSRQAAGARRRLVIRSDVALIRGKILIEVK